MESHQVVHQDIHQRVATHPKVQDILSSQGTLLPPRATLHRQVVTLQLVVQDTHLLQVVTHLLEVVTHLLQVVTHLLAIQQVSTVRTVQLVCSSAVSFEDLP